MLWSISDGILQSKLEKAVYSHYFRVFTNSQNIDKRIIILLIFKLQTGELTVTRKENPRLSWIRLSHEAVCGRLSWLLIDSDEPSSLWVTPFPGQVVWGCVSKLANCETATKQKRNFSLWILPCFLGCSLTPTL